MVEVIPTRVRNIQLYISVSLGSGSYGGVCIKAKCDGLLCAVIIMHAASQSFPLYANYFPPSRRFPCSARGRSIFRAELETVHISCWLLTRWYVLQTRATRIIILLTEIALANGTFLATFSTCVSGSILRDGYGRKAHRVYLPQHSTLQI